MVTTLSDGSVAEPSRLVGANLDNPPFLHPAQVSIHVIQNDPQVFYQMKKICLLLLVLGASLEVKAQVNATSQGKISDLIIDRYPSLSIEYSGSKMVKDNIMVKFFSYSSKNKDWPYGSGFVITHPQRDEPLWYKMVDGDFGPHSVSLLDLNGDGNLDLFFYAGFEDVFSTYAYASNYEDIISKPFSDNNFVKAYSNENDYSVLLNLQGSDHPVILDSGFEGKEHRDSRSCFEDRGRAVLSENQISVTKPVIEDIRRKYSKVTGRLDEYNFDYNMPEAYRLFNTKLLYPIKIYEIRGQESIDVTSEYPEYLKWRVSVLNKIKKSSPDKCVDNIERTIKYLQGHLLSQR